MSLQPAGHLVRSMVNPSGPLTFFPSADRPQPLSLIRLTTASRCVFHRASQAAIDVGFGAAVVEGPPVEAVAAALVAVAAPVVVAALPPSSPPQAGSTTARPTTANIDATRFERFIPSSPFPGGPSDSTSTRHRNPAGNLARPGAG